MLDRFLIRLEDMLPNMLAAVIILAGGYIAQLITLRLMGKALRGARNGVWTVRREGAEATAEW